MVKKLVEKQLGNSPASLVFLSNITNKIQSVITMLLSTNFSCTLVQFNGTHVMSSFFKKNDVLPIYSIPTCGYFTELYMTFVTHIKQTFKPPTKDTLQTYE